MDLKEHERWNEEMALKYNPDAFITKTGWIVRWVEARRLALNVKAMEIKPDSHVLDLGCGPGNLLPLIHAQRVVGLDPSDTLIEQAKKRVGHLPHIELIKGFAEKLPFKDGSFDRIVCSEVMEHVRNPEIVLKEMKRVAKPEARIVITVPNEKLINFTKKWILKLGLKKWVAGEYAMSDNMLEEWHVSEVEVDRLRDLTNDKFNCLGIRSVPFPVVAFHRIFIFTPIS